MIAADRAELESRLKQLTLQIREKEVTVFTENFAVLSTQAAFLCGLGFSGLTMVPTWQRDTAPPTAMLLVFYSLASISIGFNILTMAISSWCMIFGPGLAIRGPPGSMKRAVEGMRDEEAMTHLFFALGQVFLTLAAVALGFLKLPLAVACCIAVILVLFLGSTLAWYVRRPRASFSLTDFDGDVDFEALMLKDLDS